MGDVEELRDQLHKIEIALERLSGKVDAMAELKATDHRHLSDKIEQIDHKRHNTDVAVKALHKRLDALPTSQKMHDTVEQFAAFRNRLIGAVAFGLLGSGGLGAAVAQLIARGG